MVYFIVAALLSPFLVELVGYSWHRFVKHEGRLGERLAKEHWQHHEEFYPVERLRPDNTYRDADPYTWIVFGTLVTLTIGYFIPLTAFLGLATGVLLYAAGLLTWFHKVFHYENHWLHRFKWFRKIRSAHDLHHYMNCNYGIVFFGVDRLFGTYLDPELIDVWHKENLFPGMNEKQ